MVEIDNANTIFETVLDGCGDVGKEISWIFDGDPVDDCLLTTH